MNVIITVAQNELDEMGTSQVELEQYLYECLESGGANGDMDLSAFNVNIIEAVG